MDTIFQEVILDGLDKWSLKKDKMEVHDAQNLTTSDKKKSIQSKCIGKMIRLTV